MPKGFYKHKILFDENMPRRHRFPRLNEHFSIKHIRDDLHLAGLPDPGVYDLAVELGCVIITYNGRDFRPLSGTKKDIGIIAVPDHMPLTQLDGKLTSYLMRRNPKSLRLKMINFSQELEKENRVSHK